MIVLTGELRNCNSKTSKAGSAYFLSFALVDYGDDFMKAEIMSSSPLTKEMLEKGISVRPKISQYGEAHIVFEHIDNDPFPNEAPIP